MLLKYWKTLGSGRDLIDGLLIRNFLIMCLHFSGIFLSRTPLLDSYLMCCIVRCSECSLEVMLTACEAKASDSSSRIGPDLLELSPFPCSWKFLVGFGQDSEKEPLAQIAPSIAVPLRRYLLRKEILNAATYRTHDC